MDFNNSATQAVADWAGNHEDFHNELLGIAYGLSRGRRWLVMEPADRSLVWERIRNAGFARLQCRTEGLQPDTLGWTVFMVAVDNIDWMGIARAYVSLAGDPAEMGCVPVAQTNKED